MNGLHIEGLDSADGGLRIVGFGVDVQEYGAVVHAFDVVVL